MGQQIATARNRQPIEAHDQICQLVIVGVEVCRWDLEHARKPPSSTEIQPMPQTDTPLFARRLKAARLGAGLTQEALGVQAGIDEFSASARINQYERGKHQEALPLKAPPHTKSSQKLQFE